MLILYVQRFGDDGGAGAAGGNVDHTRIIRQELEACERELSMVKSELAEKERLIERERTNQDAVCTVQSGRCMYCPIRTLYVLTILCEILGEFT